MTFSLTNFKESNLFYRNESHLPKSCSNSNLLQSQFEKEYSPHEKLEYLKRMTTHYWNYVSKQMIKLKQLKLIDDECNLNDSKSLNLSTMSYSQIANESTNRLSFSPMSNRKACSTKCYFEYTEPTLEPSLQKDGNDLEDEYDLCDQKNELINTNAEINLNQHEKEDLTIQTALLNLILGYKIF